MCDTTRVILGPTAVRRIANDPSLPSPIVPHRVNRPILPCRINRPIGSTAQMGLTPIASRWVAKKAAGTSLGGRAPLVRKAPTPCGQSHWLAAARESPSAVP